MGSLHNIDFGVFWARWGGSTKEPGSGNRFRVQFPEPVPGNRIPDPRHCSGFRRLRARGFEGSMGSHRLGSVPEVWTELVLGTGFREPEFRAKAPKVTLYFESILLYLESIFCTLKYT